jgi:hypothetical protein
MDTFAHHTATTVAQMLRMLRTLERWLARATEHAEARKFDVDVLMSARLAPDQFALARQVQSACDSAKLGAARLADKDAPVHADTETTIAQLRERTTAVAGWLEGFAEADFAGAETRTIAATWMQGKAMTSRDYLAQFVVPNFYFHVNMAYAILRHNGIDLGKRDYLGGLTMVDP